MRVQDRAIHSDDVVVFLRHLLRHIEGKVLVLWDGSPIHRAKKKSGQRRGHPHPSGTAAGLCARIEPPFWRYLKRVELRNLACRECVSNSARQSNACATNRTSSRAAFGSQGTFSKLCRD